LRKDKRGLSTVVTTLIIILLTLVAIGIMWFAVRGLFDNSAGQADALSRCNLIDLRITSASLDATNCPALPDLSVPKCNLKVVVSRNSGGDDFSGLKLVVANSAGSMVVEEAGNIEVLGTKPITMTLASLTDLTGNPTTVKVAAYVNDASGKAQTCTASQEYTVAP
jgi:hypothetical protein